MQEDGGTLREHAEKTVQGNSVFKVNRPTPKLVEERPDFPTRAEHLWELYKDLSISRRVSMGGVMPIGWPEFYYRQQVTGERLTVAELSVVRRLDQKYFEAQQEAQQQNKPKSTKRSR